MASLRTAFFALAFAAAVTGGSLADVKHVVMIMFENRSFDHVRDVTLLCFSTARF
jgi:phospholipase C